MPLPPRLLEILVCPACHGAIHALDADSGLECERCRRVYPIHDGIPMLLVDVAAASCPGCHGSLHPLEGDGGVECERCGRIYPLRDGIAVLEVGQASAPTREVGPSEVPTRPRTGRS